MAVGFYQHALAMEPTDPFTDYFIYNHLGYSLVQLSRFEEAEERCRQAILIDSNRSNGHKDLGLALQGQGRRSEVAEAFVKSDSGECCTPGTQEVTLLSSLVVGGFRA